jgi:hypothetical protein
VKQLFSTPIQLPLFEECVAAFSPQRLDTYVAQLYRHLDDCDVCQFRSWQDGRLCPAGNRLARRRSKSE